MVYKVLDELCQLGLAEKNEQAGKIAVFSPSHPIKLKDLAANKEREAKDAQLALGSILPALTSQFNLVSGLPGVESFEGIGGLSKVYDDILQTKKDLLLFRSYLDNDHPEIDKLVNRQIKLQVANNIHTLALTPTDEDSLAEITEKDEKNLVSRRMIPRNKFELNSQIMVYGEKVAITSLGPAMISTIIDNEAISATFRTLFSYCWEKSLPDHNKLLSMASADKNSRTDELMQ